MAEGLELSPAVRRVQVDDNQVAPPGRDADVVPRPGPVARDELRVRAGAALPVRHGGALVAGTAREDSPALAGGIDGLGAPVHAARRPSRARAGSTMYPQQKSARRWR